jgi:hypothetical protein
VTTNVIRAVVLVAMLPSLAVSLSAQAIERPGPIEVFMRGTRGTVWLDTIARWQEVSAPRSITYDALLRVVTKHVKLQVENADTISKVIYNKRLIVQGALAGQPLSRWLRCGTGLTGEYADLWRVTLAYAVFVDTVSTSKSRVGVALFATARNTEGVSTSAVACASTGALESEIVSKVREVVQTL